ncbi:MAG: cadherin-like domain-containing protein, partial [Nitrospira sp.]
MPTAGARTVRYVLTDGDGGTSANYDTTVAVSGVNDPPNIVDATVALDENSANATAVTNVSDSFTGTDLDRDGEALTYSITAGNTGGAFAINAATGAITVATSAALDFETTPSFTLTVQASDGTLTDTAAITINLNNLNEAPVAGDDVAVTTENTAVTTGNVLANDSDVDSVLSPASISAFDAVSVNGGTVVNNGDGTFSYTPGVNFTGIDMFTYTVSDGLLSDTATVTITVTPAGNSVPSLAANTGSTVTQGLTDVITASELHVVDLDNTSGQLIYMVTTAPLNGHLELTTTPGVAITTFTQADIEAGRLVFVHNGAATTSDNFTFIVSDGAGGTIGASIFTFTVSPCFPPP